MATAAVKRQLRRSGRSVALAIALVASQDGIRSFLKTVDIASGKIETVYSADRHFEAPNWSHDGRFFLINSQGGLYRLRVLTPCPPLRSGEGGLTPCPPLRSGEGERRGDELERIETGSARRLNNDHGISPDGTLLVISSEPTEDWQSSSLYILPIGGGTPRQITKHAPSFWHGWSPDGRTLAFVGRRDGEFDIYTIPVDGGDERRVTTCRGLDDGPDYSPDGAFIYYNSFCSGTMQIWRMRPDGSGAEQLTHDEYANWFPHPSPDGRWVVFLSYLEDQGQSHPFGKQVKLRLLDVRDGSVRDLTAPFLGGQGTINVPSWSPDSRRVAFVSYEVVRRTP